MDQNDPLQQALARLHEVLQSQQQATMQGLQFVQGEIGALQQLAAQRSSSAPVAQGVATPVTPAAPAPAPLPGAAAGDWDAVVFADGLLAYESQASLRGDLVAGLRRGEAGATALVGSLLLFRSAPEDKMPALLKDIGEAYYRYCPAAGGTADELRDALIAWLHDRCQAAGVNNTIELVRPGDRYDSRRHHAKQRGVEVDQVYGWVVLRDNGNVYTKANVTAK